LQSPCDQVEDVFKFRVGDDGIVVIRAVPPERFFKNAMDKLPEPHLHWARGG
jgi:hypothetical protein